MHMHIFSENSGENNFFVWKKVWEFKVQFYQKMSGNLTFFKEVKTFVCF